MRILTPIIFIFTTVLANLAMKKGVGLVPSLTADKGHWPAMIWAVCTNAYLIAGMVSYAVALVAYLLMLRALELNLATLIASLNFIAVIIASSLILHERISAMRWVGFAVVALGIFIVARTIDQ